MPLPENLNQMLPVIMGIQLALGILLWFLGYRIFKSVLGFYGFLIGAALGGGLAAVLGAGQLIAIIAAVVVGLICAVLAVSLYFVGVFLAGAALGVFAGVSLSSALKGVPLLTLILGVVLGVIGGLAALLLQKLIIILSTASIGSAEIVIGAAYFLTSGRALQWFSDPSAARKELGPVAVLWLLVAIVGVLIQYTITGKKRPEPRAARRAER